MVMIATAQYLGLSRIDRVRYGDWPLDGIPTGIGSQPWIERRPLLIDKCVGNRDVVNRSATGAGCESRQHPYHLRIAQGDVDRVV